MKKTLPYALFLAFSLSSAEAAARVLPDGSVCVYRKGGGVDVFRAEVLKSCKEEKGLLKLTLKNDSLVSYRMADVDSLGALPTKFPVFTSFKFNNKYNENLYTDVFAELHEPEVTATVGAIGKWLTPSFQLDDEAGLVYVGDSLQRSKVTRLRFAGPVTYTLTYPDCRTLAYTKVSDEVWSEGNPGGLLLEDVELTERMLSTNAPSNYEEREGLAKMLDGDPNTFFHSTWGTGQYDKLPLSEHPYLQVDLQEAMQEFVFGYTTRGDNAARNPLAFLVQASKDGRQWKDIRRLGVADGMPATGAGAAYVSPVIDCGEPYRYLRFTMTESQYKNYLALAEFSIHRYKGQQEPTPPVLITPAQYVYSWLPYGRDWTVKVDWLTDRATNVPRIDINVEGGQTVVSKDVYLNAVFRIDGAGVFPDMQDSVRIKGRGNSSWGDPYSSKNPYRLKFENAVKPFGMTKGKNWVLLANKQFGSMLTNVVGMKIARMVGTAGANDIVPVELYINGNYRGSYNFTQHVGLHNNSVDVDETNAVLLELDTYFDEVYKFESDFYRLKTNVKAPDLEELPRAEALVKFNTIRHDFNDFCKAVYHKEGVENRVDAQMLARFLLVNELIYNQELRHPKSTFLYREDLKALHSRYVFGPVWDFDWAYGYDSGRNYCTIDPAMDYYSGLDGAGGPFFRALRFDTETVKRACYREWKDFMDHHLRELEEYIDDYYAYAAPSLLNNSRLWYDGAGYEEVAARFKDWLNRRAQAVYAGMEQYDLDEPLPIEKGDVNGDGAITLADVVCVYNHLLGLANETFDSQQADANGNGEITVADIVRIVAWAMQAETDASRHFSLPVAEASLRLQPFAAAVGQVAELPLSLQVEEGRYAALQLDVALPAGMTLEGVALPETWQRHRAEYAPLAVPGKYRVLIYAADGTAFASSTAGLQLLVKSGRALPPAERVVSLEAVTWVNALGEDERMSGRSVSFDMEVTGIGEMQESVEVRGGESLWIEAQGDARVKVYTLDGRLVLNCRVAAGTHRFDLPGGVYIVNRQKVVIHQEM